MKKSFLRLLLLLACVILFASSAFAEHLFGPDELDTTYGATLRLRQEIWDNAFDLNTLNTPNRNFFRLKTYLWTRLDYDKKVALRVALTNEAKYYLPVSTFKPTPNSRLDEDELVFDNLFVDLNLKKLMNIPVDLRLGRQDFLFTHGEGFLLMDGTPGDGSRTFYFNAAKANIKFNDNHNVDLIYITNPRTDIYLPSLNTPPAKKRLNTSDEQGFVVYGRNKISPQFSIEPYYIYKTEDPFGANQKLKLNTVGARAVLTAQGWRVRGEFAHQFGEYNNGRDREGNGGYLFVGRKYTDVALKPEFDLGFIFLSGDDPNTAAHEGWNPLFSRWPIWSELFIFTQARETAADSAVPAYWTNLKIIRANAKVHFTPDTNLSVWYNYLWADESTKGLNAAMFSNSGKDRGHLPQAMLSHKFSKKVDGYLLVEHFIPGNFYNSNADSATFFRWQLQVKL